MDDIFLKVHDKSSAEETLNRIRDILTGLYGEEKGEDNFRYLAGAAAEYLRSLSSDDIGNLRKYDRSRPYDHLKGKVFAISYPDNVYTETEPTLKTLSDVLSKYFPKINGIHILPERLMSHSDVWPQDFLRFLSPGDARDLVTVLESEGFLDSGRCPADRYGKEVRNIREKVIPSWLKKRGIDGGEDIVNRIMKVLDAAYNSHFNDGGFSQKTRAEIDPRFGDAGILRSVTSRFSVMLDYVVNHLDIDNEYLENFRKGLNSGEAFIIVSPSQYEEMKRSGEIEKTFRPRPFPLYTGVRKYPDKRYETYEKQTVGMNRIYSEAGFPPLDERVIRFFSIYFKIRNDQGLTAEDKRIFSSFCGYLLERGIDENTVFTESRLQPAGKMFVPSAASSMESLADLIGIDKKYAEMFSEHDDEVFGEKFFIYTTFSESQVDIYPASGAGFRMIIDDLFHLLSSGRLAMMRMDAIKYLWKERGKINFNMEEGNRLIEVIRLLMDLTAPGVLPLDEVNSPDPVVYEMEKDGGFAYLFGQVNATAAAFNEESLRPLENFYRLFDERRPVGFVPFIMLSTHDGRSVQGLGVQRTDGHVTFRQFYNLKNTVETQGGRAKYRSVPKGKIGLDTFSKVIDEAGLGFCRDRLVELFREEDDGETLVLKESYNSKEELCRRMAEKCGRRYEDIRDIPAVDYFLDWIVEGKTIYELCATSRSTFVKNPGGKPLSPEMEARRFVLAQGFVLSFGQAVPAVYMNDLLGLENDEEGYALSGKPRDLNRHKSSIAEFESASGSDPFVKEYIPRINRIIDLRVSDPSFYPGSRNFEFVSLEDTVFLNHSFHEGKHSVVIGNISHKKRSVEFDLSSLKNFSSDISGRKDKEYGMRDFLEEEKVAVEKGSIVKAELGPYGLIWLSGM